MWRVRRFLLRLVTFGRPEHAEEELSREIGSHFAQLEDEFKRRGMSGEDADLPHAGLSAASSRPKNFSATRGPSAGWAT